MARRGAIPRPWSSAEDDALLRAWAEAVVSGARSLAKELQRRFSALVAESRSTGEQRHESETSAGGGEQRTTSSITQRRSMFIRVHDAVCEFEDRRQRLRALTDCGDNDDAPVYSIGDDVASYSNDTYYELSFAEQRQWVASLGPRTYTVTPIDRHTFERVAEILKRSNDSRAERVPFWDRSHTGGLQGKKREGDATERLQQRAQKRATRTRAYEAVGGSDSDSKRESESALSYALRLAQELQRGIILGTGEAGNASVDTEQLDVDEGLADDIETSVAGMADALEVETGLNYAVEENQTTQATATALAESTDVPTHSLHDQDMGRREEDAGVVVAPTAQRIDDDANESSGSSTESDDDRPEAPCDANDSNEALSPGHVSNHTSSLRSAQHQQQQAPPTPLSLEALAAPAPAVESDLADLVGTLQTQAQLLHEMFDREKRTRAGEVQGRRVKVAQMRMERVGVQRELTRCAALLALGQHEWRTMRSSLTTKLTRARCRLAKKLRQQTSKRDDVDPGPSPASTIPADSDTKLSERSDSEMPTGVETKAPGMSDLNRATKSLDASGVPVDRSGTP